MEKHINILGILMIVFGIIGLIGAAIAFFVFIAAGLFAESSASQAEVMVATGVIGTILVFSVLITSVPTIIAGWGIMKYKSWGRILGIVISILSLPGFPFGTAIGIYGLWILFNDDTKRLFDAPPVQSA